MRLLFSMILALHSFHSLAQDQSCEQTSLLSKSLAKSIEHINQAVYADLYSCLEKLSSDGLVTEGYQKDFWKTIEGKKQFMFRCSEGNEKEEIRFLMIGKEGIESLNYPVYSYKVSFRDGSTDTASLPRNFLRFYQNGKEYIMIETFETVKMVPRANLAAAAKEELTNVNKIETEYFKKYETFLKEGTGKTQVTPEALPADKLSSTTPCFEKILHTYIRQIVDKEARKLIPYNNQFNPDLQKIYAASREELRANKELTEKYKYTVPEIKKKITDYFFSRLGGQCTTQIDATILDSVLEKFYQKDLENYGTVQRVISQRIL
jgi:hypothetical protein